MKILFLCGSIEPGKDGVGDYTRRLAAELIREEHEAVILSIHDSFITNYTTEHQYEEGTIVSVMRWPSIVLLSEKIAEIKKQISSFKPDWISLQYVLYAYHPKGLPFRLARMLQTIPGPHQWHIMFHELWVGKEDGTALKMKLLSFLQRNIIGKMIRLLQPAIIHTHLPAYKTNLAKLGREAAELPLFSNIKQFLPPPKPADTGIVKVAFFSQVEATPVVLRFLEALQKQIVQSHRMFQILLLGGAKKKMEVFRDRISYLENETTSVQYVGFLSPENLSLQLSACALGITPVIQKGLGKSGSVAAFLEHGIPVGVPEQDRDESPFFSTALNEALLLEPDLEKLALASTAAKKAKQLVSLRTITQQFITDLIKASNSFALPK